MNKTGSTLINHCGTRKVSREELKDIPIPEGTRTHQPLSHYEIVEVLEEALSYRYLKVIRDEYAVSPDGMKMFGVMDLNSEFDGCRFSIGMRNSNDKTMRLALTAGLRVKICDNMMFSGDFNPLLHKHTRNLELSESIALAVDRIHRNFLPLQAKVSEMKKIRLADKAVKLIIYEAFVERKLKGLPRHLLPLVHKLYFEPQYEEFEARNLWSLSNAFTSALKGLAPIKHFELTARLSTFLGGLQERQDVKLFFQSKEAIENKFRLAAERLEAEDFFSQSDRFTEVDDFDEDDVAEDPSEAEEFDPYFDEEAETEAIDEAEAELPNEFIRRAA